MGIFLALSAAATFGLGSAFSRRGMRGSPHDDGLLPMLAVNVAIIGVTLPLTRPIPFRVASFVAFAAGGVLGTLAGRTALLKAIRGIGPTRANAFLTATPIVTALIGWIALGEELTIRGSAGMGVAIAGLWSIAARDRSGSAGTRDRRRNGSVRYGPAILTPLLFGGAFVVRKFGIDQTPTPVFGAFVGAVTALGALIFIDLRSGIFGRKIAAYRGPHAWWFLWAGVATALALLMQFASYEGLPAWVVSLCQGTQALWTLGWSVLILRGEEQFDASAVAGIVAVAIGIGIVTVSV